MREGVLAPTDCHSQVFFKSLGPSQVCASSIQVGWMSLMAVETHMTPLQERWACFTDLSEAEGGSA